LKSVNDFGSYLPILGIRISPPTAANNQPGHNIAHAPHAPFHSTNLLNLNDHGILQRH